MALAKTNVSPEDQVRALIDYNDTLAAGASLETGASSLNDFGNSVISQLNRIINSTVTGNDWFNGLTTTTSGKTRGVNDLNVDLADLEEQKLLCRGQVLADVTVGASENWVVLGVGELPTEVVAISGTQDGAVGASSSLSGAGFEVHELIEITGPNAIAPKNLVLVRDASTLQPLQSGGRDVYGLLQFESGLADGDTIMASSPDRAKISFVRINSTGDDLEAVPVADIENEVINYSYVFRNSLESVPEDCFLSNGTFTDLTASVDVTRQEAYTNQGTNPVNITSSATLDLEGAGVTWAIRDDAEADLFTITENSATSATDVTVGSDVDTYNNNAVDVNFDTQDTTVAGTRSVRNTTPNLDADGITAPGSVTNEVTYFSVENGSEGNVSLNLGTGYTSDTGTNTFQVSVVSCGVTAGVDADTITAFTNNGAGTNPTATTTGSATFSAGDLIMVTGVNNDTRNNGIFEVFSHSGTTLTLTATPTAGAEFVRQQVATTTGDSAPVCLVTVSVFRVSSTGNYSVAEAVSNTGSLTYVDIGADATTLENAVNNQLGIGAFTQSAGDLQWGIPDGGSVQIGDAANNVRIQVSGDGASGGGITVTGGDTSAGAGGSVDIDGGAATTATEAGGVVSVTGGTGNGSGVGGAVTIDGGAGGATGAGSAVTVTGGDGGSTSGNAAGVTLLGGTPVDGNGGNVTLIGSDGVGTNRNGGTVAIGWGLATGTGLDGTVDLLTAVDVSVGQDRDVFRIRNRGSGTGGGETMEVYTGTAAPSHTATTGSLFLYDDASDGRLYVNESATGSGTAWSRVTTESQAVTRQFFQTTMVAAVGSGDTIDDADVTGTLPTKPSSNFTFDTDAEIHLNGVLLLNGTGNEVADSTGTSISVESGGPTFQIDDVITIIYYTNSTAG